jgi:hypothetical protein
MRSVSRRGPLLVAAVVLAAWTAWVGVYLARHHTAMSFVHVGRRFALQSPRGAAIVAAAADPEATDRGFDGQFVYYIAVDPGAARFHMDAPAYRYARILYPLLARAAGLGSARLVPWAMLGINLLALAATVWALGTLLAMRGVSPWWALVYGYHPGMVTVIQGDLTEALAYALVALGVLLLARPSGAGPAARRRVILGAGLLGLAGLTRETTVLFPAAVALGRAWTARRAPAAPRARAAADAAALLALGVLPAVIWHLVVYAWLGSAGLQPEVSALPLGGLLSYWPFSPPQWLEVPTVALPAVVLAALALVALVRPGHADDATDDVGLLIALSVNALFLCVLLQRSSWSVPTDSLRVTTGLALAALLALPGLRLRLPAARVLLPVAAALWFAAVPFGLLVPHTFHVFKL